MSRYTILIDVDNVLEDLNTAWVNALNKKYGFSVLPTDIIDWDIHKFFKGLSRTQVFSPLHNAEFWEQLTPIDKSQYYIERLINEGYEVYLLTSSHPDTIRYKYKFLHKYFPQIPFRNIIFCSNKQMVNGDVLVDDAPHNLIGGVYDKILMDAPHNKSFDAKLNGMYRVHNWDEIYYTISKLYKSKQKGTYWV